MLSRFMTRREQFVLVAVAVAVAGGAMVLYVTRASASREPEPAAPALLATEAASPPPKPREEPLPEPIEVASVEVSTPAPVEAKELKVAVVGAVVRPGLYSFEPGARVHDAVVKAGGARAEADTGDLNLAAPLIDGTTLTVPAREVPESGAGRLVVRPQPIVNVNPSEYTLSGWRAGAGKSGAAGPGAAESSGAPEKKPAAAEKGSAEGKLDLNRASEAQLETLPGIGRKLASEIVRYRSRTPFGRVDDVLSVNGVGPKKLEAIRPLVTVE